MLGHQDVRRFPSEEAEQSLAAPWTYLFVQHQAQRLETFPKRAETVSVAYNRLALKQQENLPPKVVHSSNSPF
jgi:hypothetical protein